MYMITNFHYFHQKFCHILCSFWEKEIQAACKQNLGAEIIKILRTLKLSWKTVSLKGHESVCLNMILYCTIKTCLLRRIYKTIIKHWLPLKRVLRVYGFTDIDRTISNIQPIRRIQKTNFKDFMDSREHVS